MHILPPDLYDEFEQIATESGGLVCGAIYIDGKPGCAIGMMHAVGGYRSSVRLQKCFEPGSLVDLNNGTVANYLRAQGKPVHYHDGEGRLHYNRMPWPEYKKAMGIVRGEEVDAQPLMSSIVETAPELVEV